MMDECKDMAAGHTVEVRRNEKEPAEGAKMTQIDPPDEIPLVWHKTQLRIPLFEVDLGQAVYHGNYYHFFEMAREDFLRDLGYPYKRFMEQQMHLTVVESSCSYRRSLRYDDLIEAHTSILWRRSRSLAFSQIFFRDEGEAGLTLCTRATLNMVCVSFTGKPTVLPADFTRLIEDRQASSGSLPSIPS